MTFIIIIILAFRCLLFSLKAFFQEVYLQTKADQYSESQKFILRIISIQHNSNLCWKMWTSFHKHPLDGAVGCRLD